MYPLFKPVSKLTHTAANAVKRLTVSENKEPLLKSIEPIACEERQRKSLIEQNSSEIWKTAADWFHFREEDYEYKDDGYIELVLKMLGLLCDGQNKGIQDFLREQPENIKSVNLVMETTKFLSLIYSSINSNTIGLVSELFNTLTEFTSGNIANQVVVFDNKVIDYINYILRDDLHDCSLLEIIELKKTIALFLFALIEENHVIGHGKKAKSIGVERDVAESLEIETVFKICLECYKKASQKVFP